VLQIVHVFVRGRNKQKLSVFFDVYGVFVTAGKCHISGILLDYP
jgi:hypothetical protein